jgi:hypothetical protein
VDGTLSSHVTTRIPHEAMLVPSWLHIQRGHAPSWARCVLMIAHLWRCALHEVGLSKRLAVSRPSTQSELGSRRLPAQHSTAQHSTAQHSTAQHSTAQHSTASPALPYRIRCMRLVSVIDHTVCSRDGPSRKSEAQCSRTCTQSLVLPTVLPLPTYTTCIFPSVVLSAQQ